MTESATTSWRAGRGPAPLPAALPALLVLLALLLVVAAAAPARAHARLVGSDPAAGSAVSRSPESVTLTFDGPVKQQFTSIAVSGADGVSYSDGTPGAFNDDVEQKVKALPSGEIVVTWRTVAADGAPLQGRYTFTNTDPAAPAVSPAPSSPTTGTAGGTPSRRGGGAGATDTAGNGDAPLPALWLVGGASLVAVLALLGVLLVRSVRRP
ncbi:copper resistance CopC family protein [Streptomyces marokkonensis]|uniref:copper resistance CopC family protein n=1 Tax=Streptomyces marokkonensis TaxID=324855 RepID=UPI0011F2ADBC|nr:copper resistance CopC family protein [Streptomyces marokkonensis]